MKSITIPLELPKPKRNLTNACHELYRRLNPFGSFVAESLVSASLFEQKMRNEDFKEIQIKPDIYYWYHVFLSEITEQKPQPIPVPEITIKEDIKRQGIRDLPRALFHTAITQLAAAYEIFLHDLAEEVYLKNTELLVAKEKQLSTEEILQLGSFDSIIEELKDRAVNNLISLSYPNIVERFGRVFHIGIHDKNSPASLFAVHHLIEKRNIIVHNNGWVSKNYMQRMSVYSEPSIIEFREEVPINFEEFFDDLELVVKLALYVDECIQKKWKVHSYSYEDKVQDVTGVEESRSEDETVRSPIL